jgi:hypothetical protein
MRRVWLVYVGLQYGIPLTLDGRRQMLRDAADKARVCCHELADVITQSGAHLSADRIESVQALALLETALVRLGLLARDEGVLPTEQAALQVEKVGSSPG